MKRRRVVFAVGAAAGAGGLALGTNAFSSVQADRGMTIDVVGDDAAYLMMEYRDLDLTDTPPPHEVGLVTLGNLFDTPIEIETVALEDTNDDVAVSIVDAPDSLDVGERADVVVAVECEGGGEHATTVRFDLRASGEEVFVETTEPREVDIQVDCRGPFETVCNDLLAAQDVDAGAVCVENDTEALTVTYRTERDCGLRETHLAVGTDLAEYRDEGWVTENDVPRPGRFPYTDELDPPVGEFAYTIPLADLDADPGDEIVIAAHAVVDCDGEIQDETAWADGERFTDRSWATYVEYEIR